MQPNRHKSKSASEFNANLTTAALNDTQQLSLLTQPRMISLPTKGILKDNPCERDLDLCRKKPSGNASFICVKSFITQDYTLCLPTKSMSCKNSNPCLNGGICVEEESSPPSLSSSMGLPWRCICSREFSGRLCESETCSSVFQLFQNHTMCAADSKHFLGGEVNSSDIELIVDFHNAIRRQVAPIASNMQKVRSSKFTFKYII